MGPKRTRIGPIVDRLAVKHADARIALEFRNPVELRRTPYAIDAAVAAIRASGYPDAEQLAGWLLEPEDPDEISAYFESIA